MEGGQDKARRMPLRSRNENVRSGELSECFLRGGDQRLVAQQYGATCLMGLNVHQHKHAAHAKNIQRMQYLYCCLSPISHTHTHTHTRWPPGCCVFLRNGMYCQVTQLEQQGGPEIRREMVRDREKAAHERLSGWRRSVNALEKKVCTRLQEGIE